jgi:hypothetical protein
LIGNLYYHTNFLTFDRSPILWVGFFINWFFIKSPSEITIILFCPVAWNVFCSRVELCFQTWNEMSLKTIMESFLCLNNRLEVFRQLCLDLSLLGFHFFLWGFQQYGFLNSVFKVSIGFAKSNLIPPKFFTIGCKLFGYTWGANFQLNSWNCVALPCSPVASFMGLPCSSLLNQGWFGI